MSWIQREIHHSAFFGTKDGFRFALTYGPDAEWVRNALDHGAVRLITHGKEYELTEPELVTDLHRQHVPAIGRAIMRLMRVTQFLDFRSPVEGVGR